MTTDELLDLLYHALLVLERYQFDGEECRHDVAEICMKIDDVFSTEPPMSRFTDPESVEAACA